MKLLRIMCVVALALSFVTSVYAGTQSVKISGDLEVRGIFRDNYGIGNAPEGNARTGVTRSNQEWFMSTVEAQIDADLTDNVSAVVRLANMRDWNIYAKNITVGPAATTIATNGRYLGGGYTASDDEFDLLVDLAYIELKEFLYSPLTLKIGRQDMWFGKGFIVGLNQQDPNGNLAAPEYTTINSFDAIRATLDYDPWTVDAVYSNIYGNTIQASDGVNLLGTNIGYIFDSYNAESEAYYWYKSDKQIAAALQGNNDVHTIGLRGSADPIEFWTVGLEGAFQFGNSVATDLQIDARKRRAWGFDASVETRQFADDFAWKPVITAEYIYYSGDKHAADLDAEVQAGDVTTGIYASATPTKPAGSTVGTNTGWDPMLRGKFDTKYREFIGRYYATTDYPVRPRMYQSTADASFTNQHQALLGLAVLPTDSLTATGKLAFFWLDEDATNLRTKKYVGTEFDMHLVWDYTEDVSFGVLGAWFFPGNLYVDDENVATDLMGSVKLSF
ncbi:MAG: alginate export family protein [Omnitrophica bacterium]|nr:alginate export family protein [Candidatus Omnitrophota bacterium]